MPWDMGGGRTWESSTNEHGQLKNMDDAKQYCLKALQTGMAQLDPKISENFRRFVRHQGTQGSAKTMMVWQLPTHWPPVLVSASELTGRRAHELPTHWQASRRTLSGSVSNSLAVCCGLGQGRGRAMR